MDYKINDNFYEIPFEAESKCDSYINAIYLFIIITSFACFLYMLFSLGFYDINYIYLFEFIVVGTINFTVFYSWLFMDILKEGRIIITNEKLLIRTTFRNKKIELCDIESINLIMSVREVDEDGYIYCGRGVRKYLSGYKRLALRSYGNFNDKGAKIEIKYIEDDNCSLLKYIFKKLTFCYGVINIRCNKFSKLDPNILYSTLKSSIKRAPKSN